MSLDKSVDDNDITVNNSYDTHTGDNDGYNIVSRKPSSTTNANEKAKSNNKYNR